MQYPDSFATKSPMCAMTTESLIIHSNLHNLSSYSFQINRWFLKPIGAWPLPPSTPRREKIVSFVLIVISYSCILFTVIPSSLRMILQDESLHIKVKIFGPLIHWLLGGVNYTTLLLRANDIRYCMDHIDRDWRRMTRKKDQQVMIKNAQLGRYVAILCAVFVQTGITSFCVMTALTTHIIRIGNETRTVRLLPCAVYNKLFAADRSPMNEIMLVSQFVSGFIVNTGELGVFCLAAVLAAHACGQLHVLMLWITDSVNDEKNRKEAGPFREIGLIVRHHLRVLNFISHIEEMMNRVCFLELFRSIVAICVLSYYILTEWDEADARTLASYFIIFTAVSFNTFIICYIGEVLAEQCEKVGEVVYMTNWYHLPDKSILDLMLIMARSSVVVQITAGKIVHLSLCTFSDVMKSAFAYMNLLRQMT